MDKSISHNDLSVSHFCQRFIVRYNNKRLVEFVTQFEKQFVQFGGVLTVQVS